MKRGIQANEVLPVTGCSRSEMADSIRNRAVSEFAYRSAGSGVEALTFSRSIRPGWATAMAVATGITGFGLLFLLVRRPEDFRVLFEENHAGLRIRIAGHVDPKLLDEIRAQTSAAPATTIDAALFRVIVLGGSRPPAQLPANVHTTYGLTETGSGVVYDGRPLHGAEVQLAADGEVLLRGPMLCRGYRDGTTPIDADGWLHTGDLGHWLPDGRLHVEGRRGDMIVTGGENVWPDVVEALLAAHPHVADVAVAGVPDAEWGQRVVAWVVPAAALPTLPELKALVTQQLPAFCAPKELRIVASLPRTALGKVQRFRLVGDPARQ